MRAANRVPAILRDLQTGYGAQRMPTSLLAIEVRGVTTNRTRPTVRHFLKTILPRVKYNNPALRIEIQKVKVVGSEAKQSEAKEATEGARRVKREPNASARLIFDNLPAQVVQFDGHSTANDVARSVFERIAQVTGENIQSASMGAGGSVQAHAVQTRGNAKKLSTEPKKGSSKTKTQKAKAAITAEDAADVPPLAEAEAATSSDEPEYAYTPYVKPTKPAPDAEDAAGKATQQQL